MVTNVPLGKGPFYLVMNWQTWNRLPKDIQRVFDDLSLELIKKWDECFRDQRLTYTKRFVEEFRGTTYEWPPEDIAKINERWKPLENALISDLEAKGYPARKIMDRFHELESKM
jgi:TRAP-type C4-dicarboxylate transport system substrate-binding protein